MKNLIVYTELGIEAYPIQKELTCLGISFFSDKGDVFYTLNNQKKQLHPYTLTNISDVGTVQLFNDEEIVYHRGNLDSIFIDEKESTFQTTDYKLSIASNGIKNPNKNTIYINGAKENSVVVSWQLGDQIMIDQFILIVHEKTLTVKGNHQAYTTDLEKVNLDLEHLRDFPNYHRSPRIIHRVSDEKVKLVPPPEKSKMSPGGLAAILISPLISLAGSIAMIVIMNRGMFVYIMIGTTIVTTIVSIMKYRTDKKENKKENEQKERQYERYLLKMRQKLEGYRTKELTAYAYHSPPISDIAALVDTYSSRIYEKDTTDEDFLHLLVGWGKEKSSTKVSFEEKEHADEKENPLLEEAKGLYINYRDVAHKPMSIDLKKSHVGLVGDKEEIHRQLKQMMAQVTFFHSYHDVEMILLHHESYQRTFDYVKWYPHMRISAINARGNICQEKIRDQVLASLTQILKQRKQSRDEDKKLSAFSPHYTIMIDDYSLVMNHGIMEYFQEPTTDLGFTLVFSAKQRSDLPENIKTVVMVEDLKTNRLLIKEGQMVDRVLASPQVEGINLEKSARDLSVLKHQLGVVSRIPEAITFFDLFKVEEPAELNVLQKWQENESHKTLSVPLGVRGEDDIVNLDLHEKAHGPHGLVAGTTGSGKSEIIQSYILSLAVNFHPHEVGFLLIDYKGGGMANLFSNLPHLLGTITNLDGSESMRALASIKSELKRRQKIFNDHDVNNIIKYNKLFKSGKAKEPLPSLFLISDEFAELKKEQPDFMSELVSVARIGRTLGIKLILATQKPTGVVDDQIWSNSKFKLALKVQDASDSKEIIKTPDAAYITQPGRAYMQVGNNEIYELFQSAWSGASYQNDEEEKEVETLVHRINPLGQGELVNKDLSGGDDGESNAVAVTQLDVVIDHIHEAHKSLNSTPVTKPWLPSLDPQIVSPHIKDTVGDMANYKKLDLVCALGVVDVPEKQEQLEYKINFMVDGNLVKFAVGGFGKSFMLGTMMISLAVKNSPEILQYYIIDLGNSALIPYANLPHTADYMTFDSTEKVTKFMKLITGMITERKKLFAKTMVQNFEMYNQMHVNDPLKAIIVFLDNYDLVKEMGDPFLQFVTRLARDGSGLGIYIVATGSLPSAMRHSALNQFKNKIAGFLHEKNEYSPLVGRMKHPLPEIKGRAVVKLEEINTMQLYTPFLFEDVIEHVEKTKSYIQQIKDAYTGDLPPSIPMLPDIFTSNQFKLYEDEKAGIEVRIGLCLEDVVNVDANLKSFSPYLIVGPKKTGKTNLLELYLNQMPEDSQIYLFDSSSMHFFSYNERENLNYVTDEEDSIENFVDSISNEICKRKAMFNEAMKHKPIAPQAFYGGLPTFAVFVDGMDGFVKKFSKNKDFSEQLNEACQVGVQVIVTASMEQTKGIDNVTKLLKTPTHGVVLGDQGVSGVIFQVKNKKDNPIFGQGLLFENGSYRTVLIPQFVNE